VDDSLCWAGLDKKIWTLKKKIKIKIKMNLKRIKIKDGKTNTKKNEN